MKTVIIIFMALVVSMTAGAQDKKMSELKTSQLPAATVKWVNDNVPGGKIARAGKIEEKGVITYVAVVEREGRKNSFLFDKDGKFTGKGDHLFRNAKTQQGTKNPAGSDPKQATTDPPKK